MGGGCWSGGGNGWGGNQNSTPSDNLYMKGLPAGSGAESVKSIFSVYGNVLSVKVLEAPMGKGNGTVAALVRMSSVDEAKWLVDNVNGNIPQGLTDPVEIKFASNPKGAGKGKGDWDM